MTELNIVPECYVDTKIAEILGKAKKYNHVHGSGNVSNVMQNKLKDRIVLGIIDEDKFKGRPARYFLTFETIIEKDNLVLKKHPLRRNFLVLICPEAEKWLLNDARKVNINPSDEKYNLPNEIKGFKKISKIKSIDKNEGFKVFIKDLVRAESPSITTLKKWISLFRFDELNNLSNL